MKKGVVLFIIIWLIIVATSLFWNIRQSDKQYEELALQSARSFFEQITITRDWGTQHDGVYVPVTEKTQPNPYLNTPMRDIVVSGDLLLTKINPSFMTRQISELAASKSGIQFHITSLNPLRKENSATGWEKRALQSFEKGIDETGEFFRDKNRTSYVYMAPLVAEQPCLQCHPTDRLGDIRGGISITLPMTSQQTTLPLLLGHLILCVVGIGGILLFGMILNNAYQKIHRQATIDSLTGIANRRSFSERIAEEFDRSLRNSTSLSILMCDIDNFKGYNDHYGHTAGDKCLTLVAQELNNTMRRPSDFCARYGGEEFILLLPETDISGAQRVAEKAIHNLQKLNIPHVDSPTSQMVTLSFGAASTATVVDSYEMLIKNADSALYLAKKNGKNRVELYKVQDENE